MTLFEDVEDVRDAEVIWKMVAEVVKVTNLVVKDVVVNFTVEVGIAIQLHALERPDKID